MAHQVRVQALLRPIQSVLRDHVYELRCDFEYDLLVFRGAFVSGDQNVNVAAIRVEAVRGFAARISDVDYFAFDPGRASGGPTISVVAGRQQLLERDGRIKVGGLRKYGSVFQSMEMTSATGERDPFARTVLRKREPDD